MPTYYSVPPTSSLEDSASSHRNPIVDQKLISSGILSSFIANGGHFGEMHLIVTIKNYFRITAGDKFKHKHQHSVMVCIQIIILSHTTCIYTIVCL